VPDEWLVDEPGFDSVLALRAAYVDALAARFEARSHWLPALQDTVASGGRARIPAKPGANRPTWLGGS
jgi:hypothetical protein